MARWWHSWCLVPMWRPTPPARTCGSLHSTDQSPRTPSPTATRTAARCGVPTDVRSPTSPRAPPTARRWCGSCRSTRRATPSRWPPCPTAPSISASVPTEPGSPTRAARATSATTPRTRVGRHRARSNGSLPGSTTRAGSSTARCTCTWCAPTVREMPAISRPATPNTATSRGWPTRAEWWCRPSATTPGTSTSPPTCTWSASTAAWPPSPRRRACTCNPAHRPTVRSLPSSATTTPPPPHRTCTWVWWPPPAAATAGCRGRSTARSSAPAATGHRCGNRPTPCWPLPRMRARPTCGACASTAGPPSGSPRVPSR